ncbi:MAG: amidohydrolase family protein [Candidatus Moranbacteria bacterium]|nr:amidohydrolase family protein [Candidatus Moranbacteria bacterium]
MASRTSYLIKNGTIIDGTGQKGFEGDILIDDDKIKEIGGIEENGDYKIIEAKNKIVAPGFIDVNNHSDSYWTLFQYPGGESLLTQGIATIVGGNCGSSIAPIVNEEAIESIQKYVDLKKVQVQWGSFEEFVEFMQERKLAFNFGSLVGHATIRRAFTKGEVRQLTKTEIKKLNYILDLSMKQGALGLSTGLVYSHAKIASREEIASLAKTVKANNGVYTTHLREEGENLIPSIREALSIAETTGVSLQISHLKACGEKSWPLQERVLEMIEETKAKGFDVGFDVYPYTEIGPVLYTLLPAWVVEGGKEILMQRLKDPAIRYKIIKEMTEMDFDYGEVIIATSKIDYALARYKVSQIAEHQERKNEEVILDLILCCDDTITVVLEALSSKNVEKLIAHDLSIVSSNGAGYSVEHEKTGDLVHPRCFGALPRFLKNFVFDGGTLSPEKAIQKITQKPAEKFGFIKETGTLEKAKTADVVIFDPKTIEDRSRIMKPYHYSSGITELFINGKLVILEGRLDNVKAGKMMPKSTE